MRAAAHLAADDVEALLGSWERLNGVLMELPINAVKELLKHETVNRCRPNFILRLYGRFNVLRTREERAALLSGRWINEI